MYLKKLGVQNTTPPFFSTICEFTPVNFQGIQNRKGTDPAQSLFNIILDVIIFDEVPVF